MTSPALSGAQVVGNNPNPNGGYAGGGGPTVKPAGVPTIGNQYDTAFGGFNLGGNVLSSPNVYNAKGQLIQYGTPAVVAPNAAAYTDPNSQKIFNEIAQNQGIANTQYQAQGVALAPTTTYGAAKLAPLQQTTGPQLNTAQDNAYAGGQVAQINQLNQLASGQGPNAATITADQQRQKNDASAMALAASTGGNPALAAKRAADAQAANNQAAAGQGALGSAQIQLGAQGQLASALGQARGQGQQISTAQAGIDQNSLAANQGVNAQGALAEAGYVQGAAAGNAGAVNTTNLTQGAMTNQVNLANLTAAEQQTAANAQQQNQTVAENLNENSFDVNSAIAYQNEYQQAQENLAALATGQGIAQMQQNTQLAGAGLGAGGALLGGLAMMSDRRAKRSIKPAAKEVRRFLDSAAFADPQSASIFASLSKRNTQPMRAYA